jgi:periplasmic protein TonB
MKFINRNGMFYPILISLSAHGIGFGWGAVFSPRATFSVQPAPTSIEMQFVKEIPVEKPKPAAVEEILITKAESPAEVVQEIQKEEKKEEVLPTPETQGAITDLKELFALNPAPVYPRIARQRGWEGTVELRVFVAKDGMPSEVEVFKSSGYEALDHAAQETVRGWHFVTAQSGKLRFSSWVTIPIRFQLIEQNSL